MFKLERGVAGKLPRDAVVVRVWPSSGRVVADYVCPGPAGELASFPQPVPAALHAAHEACVNGNIPRIVVVLEKDTVWRDDWGSLE